jgi:cytochrome c oxidase subunit 2
MKNGRHLIAVAVLVAIGAVITYFVLTAIYQLPTAASEEAGQIDRMFNVNFMLISALFSLVVVFMLYSFVVFRRRPGDQEDGAHFEGNTPLEIAWTIIPLVIVIALGIWGTFVLSDITSAESDEMVVNVTGRQWSWVFAYPSHEEVGNTEVMVLPVDQPIRLEMESVDVLHSFWVPEFRVKQDLVPGRTTILRFTPTEEGSYKVRCAEICGLQHSLMEAEVRVVSQDEFNQWVSDQSVSLANLAPEERGAKWAANLGCVGCHSVDGSPLVGPTWLGLVGRQESLADGSTVTVDEAYITESILHPADKVVAGFQPLMQATYGEQFAAEEARLLEEQGVDVDILADLIAYMKTLTQ